MSALTVLDFGGKNIRFERRGDRVWVSLTDMAKASGKQVNDYTRLNSSSEYIAELQAVTGIPVTDTVQGGIPEKQGSWGIEEIAIDFAAWCSVKFRVWVNQQIKTLMTEGTVSIAPAPLPRQLPPIRDVIDYLDAAERLPNITDPIIKAALTQRLAEEIGADSGLLYDRKKPVIVTILAAELGYKLKVYEDIKLGAYVKKSHLSLGKSQHGKYPVNVYERTPELEQTIHNFFELLKQIEGS